MTNRVEIGGTVLTVGDEYVRRELHEKLGGGGQGGISPSAKHPIVMLFPSPGGIEHGYGYNGWTKSGHYEYTGEGRPNLGDQRFVRGNKAIRDHEKHGRRLFLFQAVMDGKRRTNRVRFEGELEYCDHRIAKVDTAGYGREVIVFELKPV